MECTWSVDEDDGCTLKVQCNMRSACDSDECYDLDMLLDRALREPRHITESGTIITGKH